MVVLCLCALSVTPARVRTQEIPNVKNAIGNVVSNVGDVVSKVAERVKDATEVAEEKGKAALDAAKELGTDVVEKAKDAATTVRTEIDEAFDKATGVTTKAPAAPITADVATTAAPAAEDDADKAKDVVAAMSGVCPAGCTEWFDGCNTCQCAGVGQAGRCTKKACAKKLLPNCSVMGDKKPPVEEPVVSTAAPDVVSTAAPDVVVTKAPATTSAAPDVTPATTTAKPGVAGAVEALAASLNCTVHVDDLEWTLDVRVF